MHNSGPYDGIMHFSLLLFTAKDTNGIMHGIVQTACFMTELCIFCGIMHGVMHQGKKNGIMHF